MGARSLPNFDEAGAIRDGLDLIRLEILSDAVRDWLHQIRDFEPLHHPDSRWHPDDLRGALTGNLVDIAAEITRCRGPLTIPSDD